MGVLVVRSRDLIREVVLQVKLKRRYDMTIKWRIDLRGCTLASLHRRLVGSWIGWWERVIFAELSCGIANRRDVCIFGAILSHFFLFSSKDS